MVTVPKKGYVILLNMLTIISSASASSASQKVSTASDQFGVALYQNLKPSQNNFFSPYSITTALSMVYIGAGGQTAAEMSESLFFDKNSLSSSDVTSGYKSLSSQLTGQDKNYTLNIANADYVAKKFTLEDSYRTALTDDFNAKAVSVDFESNAREVTNQINEFVSSATKSMIPKILNEPLPPDTLLVLINAIYFKGTWTYQFKETDTQSADFTSGTTKQKCQLMYQTARFNYYFSSDLNSQVLEMPYSGGDVSMVVILPEDSTDLSSLSSKVSYDNLNKAVSNMYKQVVDVYFPKFTLRASYELSDVLMKMGFKTMFSDSADFTGISKVAKMKVSKVIHEALVIVDEKGTTAAAATVVTGALVSSVNGPPQPILFRADHPFVFVIRHIPSGMYLFFGSVQNPESS